MGWLYMHVTTPKLFNYACLEALDFFNDLPSLGRQAYNRTITFLVARFHASCWIHDVYIDDSRMQTLSSWHWPTYNRLSVYVQRGLQPIHEVGQLPGRHWISTSPERLRCTRVGCWNRPRIRHSQKGMRTNRRCCLKVSNRRSSHWLLLIVCCPCQ